MIVGCRAYVDKPIEKVHAFQFWANNEAILMARNNLPPDQWYEISYEDLPRVPVDELYCGSIDYGTTVNVERQCAELSQIL